MIKLEKNGRTMEARTEVQASAFINNGWKKVDVENPSTENQSDGTNEKKEYKKSDISRMNKETLKELATKIGVEFTEETTGEKLKEEIIAKLEL